MLPSVPETELAHQFQGSSAHKKKIGKAGRVWSLGRSWVKTNVKTAISKIGLRSDQKKPNAECL